VSHEIVPPEDEHLTTGWEPDLPADDTLVRRAVLVHASWAVAVAGALGRPAERTDTWAAGFVGERGALTNPVVLQRPLAEDEVPALLEEVGRVVPETAPYLLLSPFPLRPPPDSRLALLGHPPLMVRLPGGEAPSLASGVEVVEVREAETLAVAERVLVEGFPMPELQPLRAGAILAPPILDGPTRVWLATVDGEPAAVAAAHTHGDAVLVEYVAALAGARGRGAGGAVTWAATLADPSLPAVLVSSDDGRGVYERLGYLAIERWTAHLRLPLDT
jgi:hypothetical protein